MPQPLDFWIWCHSPTCPLGPQSTGPPNHWSCSQPCFLPQDIYENLDLQQRRASSPGYIDSLTYSLQGMSPTLSCSPHHYYHSGKERGEPGDCTVAQCPSFRDSTGLPQDLCHSMALLWRPVATQILSWALLKLCRCPLAGAQQGYVVLRCSGKVGGELPEEERGRQPEGLAGRRLWP